MANAVEEYVNAKWDEVATKYEVHPETRESTLQSAKENAKPISEIGLEAFRAQFLELLKKNGSPPFEGKVQDVVIPSQHNKAGIPARVYTPASVGANPTLQVYFHGGCLISGSIDGYDSIVKLIASYTKTIVVSVDYRLLPNEDDPFSPFNECAEATRWVKENKVVLGGQTSSKVGIMGDSAGGQICICVSHEVSGVDFQVLIYPVASFDYTLNSYIDFQDLPTFNTNVFKMFADYFIQQTPDAPQNVRFNPALRENFESVPPTLLLLAQLDPLTDGALEYGRKLEKAGVPTEIIVVKGFAHGFMCTHQSTPTGFQQGLEYINKFVRLQTEGEKSKI